VPGRSAFDYLQTQDIDDQSLFVAPNAVDNKRFADAAESVRKQATVRRDQLGLPPRYFLFVGRLVREKGIFELLKAYAKLDAQMRQEIGLVMVGDGPCREQLQLATAGISPGTVVFPGFVHREQLGDYYGLAEAFVLPTYTDTWGMVVNEAMACGLPVIVSRSAGCAADLVRDQRNGILVRSKDVDSLEAAMKRLGGDCELRQAMRGNSKRLILDYSPEKWATSVVEAFHAMVK
jgi:glycosyltransferase involved in cell wall biosynthesis